MKPLSDTANTLSDDLLDLGAATVETRGGAMQDDLDGAVFQKRPHSGLSND